MIALFMIIKVKIEIEFLSHGNIQVSSQLHCQNFLYTPLLGLLGFEQIIPTICSSAPPPLSNEKFPVYACIKIISSTTTIIFTCRITCNLCLGMLWKVSRCLWWIQSKLSLKFKLLFQPPLKACYLKCYLYVLKKIKQFWASRPMCVIFEFQNILYCLVWSTKRSKKEKNAKIIILWNWNFQI